MIISMKNESAGRRIMVRRRCNRTVCVLIALFALAILHTDANALALKIATLSPDGTTWMKKMREGAKEIADRTDDRVKFKFYPGGIMGNDESVLRKIRIGQLQGGAVVSGSLARIYPDIQIYTLPFLFRSYDEVDYVRERMDQQLVKGLAENGFVTFGFAEGGFGYLMSQAPITTIEQLRSQRIWVQTGDTVTHIMFHAADVSAISLPLSDVLTGLQTGLINTIATSPIVAIALQWHTKIKYMVDTPLAYIYALLAVDQKAFSRIAEPDRAIVHQVMDRVFVAINRQNRLDSNGAINALNKQGIKFLYLEQQQLEHWKSIA
ncbi:MAG: TRAP transporter substrate-binding protein DctP, partial [Gammaproteobacteria bacterium]